MKRRKFNYLIGAFVFACVPLLVSSAVCRYCSGTKWRTVTETCPKCKGQGVVFDATYHRATCKQCEGIRGGLSAPSKRGEVRPASGKIKKRIPCDKCPKAVVSKEYQLSTDDLNNLNCGKPVEIEGIRLIPPKE